MSENFVKLCRDTARTCSDVLLAKLLQDRADDLMTAIDRLHSTKDVEDMRQLNAKWVRAYNAYEKAKLAPPPPTPGRTLELKAA